MTRLLLSALALVAVTSGAVAQTADYSLSVVETGQRDYYCTVTLRLDNASDGTVNDLNGSVVLLAGDEAVGQSRASSFLNVGPGETGERLFEAPNAPCAEVTEYRFDVNSCRIDGSFRDASECATRLAPEIASAVSP
ncbi:MAG: hypothetical protein AAFX39_15355 [Pseudomonadota bacterium]